MVVELGVDGPRVGRLEQVDDRLGRVRVVRVGAGQDAAAALAQARRRDRAAHELGRDRLLVVLVDSHVAGHERVDVAGDEHHVLDLLAAQVLQQLVALARIALPGVEADVVAAGVDRRHDHHLVGHHLPRRLRAGQPLLGEVHLAPAEEVARRVEVVAGRPDLGVAAGLVGPVLALVEQQQVDGLPEAHAAVDAVVARALGAVGGHAVEERAVGGGLARRRVAQLRREPAGRPGAAGVVVLDLVVVPDRDHREQRVHVAQRRVGAVERVLGAVLLERLREADRVGAHPADARRRPRSRPRRRCSRPG